MTNNYSSDNSNSDSRLVVLLFGSAFIVGSILFITNTLTGIHSSKVTLASAATLPIPEILPIDIQGASASTTNVEFGYELDKTTPVKGEVIEGYTVTDIYGIRAVHPTTGEHNVRHNGVDLGTPVGVPLYAIGKTGDDVTVTCWWDPYGGGNVVNQTTSSYPEYVFQFLHTNGEDCKEGKGKAGDRIAYTGGSGIGTGAHYDFRMKLNGSYVPPYKSFLKSSITGNPIR